MFEGETSGVDANPEAMDFHDLEFPVESAAPQRAPGGNFLTPRQTAFAKFYVLEGGNSTKAAALAGYSSPGTMGTKCLVHPHVLHEIKRLAIVHTEALLPIAIRQLLLIGCDPTADAKARVQALTALLDRGGMKPKGDTTAVQVNVQINGQAAQAAIAEVWKERERRLTTSERLSRMGSEYQNRQLSDIAGGMSDISDVADSGVTIDAAASAPTASRLGVGGVHLQGPSPVPSIIPPPAPEHEAPHPESLLGE